MRPLTRLFLLPVVLALALSSPIAACSNDDPVSPPPEPTKLATIAKIVYTTESALVFTNHRVPVRSLVKAYDSAGVELSPKVLALALPAGWTRVNDSLSAPSLERAGTLVASPAPGYTVAPLRASFANAVGDAALLTAGLDLRTFGWVATWKCAQPEAISNLRTANGVPIDSVIYNAVIDSVSYASDSSFLRNYGGVAQMWWSGNGSRFLRDGTRDTIFTADPIPISRQAPDSLIFDPSFTGTDKLLVIRSGAGTTYTGGSWCRSDWPTREAVTLSGIAKIT